jgi:hypothetical protein
MASCQLGQLLTSMWICHTASSEAPISTSWWARTGADLSTSVGVDIGLLLGRDHLTLRLEPVSRKPLTRVAERFGFDPRRSHK